MDTESTGEAAQKTPSRRDWISLISVLVVQTQNAFNDNLVKFVLIGLALAVAAGTPIGDNIQFILSALLPIPFILLAPIAGFFADRFSKQAVIYRCLIAQLLIFLFIAGAVYFSSIPLAVLGFFLLSVQSTFFSPAKMGILKELVGSERLGMANGLMQMLTMVGILAGMWLGGLWFDSLLRGYNQASANGPETASAWSAALWPIGAVGAASLVPLVVARFIQRTPAHRATAFSKTIFFRHFTHLRYVFSQRGLRLTVLGIAYYWFVAYFVGLVLVAFGKEMHPDLAQGGASSATAGMTAVIGIGLMVGSTLVSLLSRHRIDLGMVPFGGLGMTLSLWGLGVFAPGSTWFSLSLAFLGFTGGFYVVPLSAHLQDQAEEAHRGRVLSANNLVVSLTGVIAIGAGLLLENTGFTPSAQILFFVLPTLLVSAFVVKLLPQGALRFPFLVLLLLIYRVRSLHPENVPKKGGALVICNHVSYIDAFLLTAASPREVRFVMFDHYRSVWWMAWFLRIFNVIFISKTRAKEAIVTTADALRKGSLVCVFPEGQLTRTGVLNELKKGFQMIARQAEVPVLPAYIDSLWGSIFSFERNKFLYKIPRRFPYGVTVNFGAPIPPEEVTADRARKELQELSVEAFASREPLQDTLPAALARSLKKRGRATAITDRTGKRIRLSRATLLATAETLASHWRKTGLFDKSEHRVALALPHGSPALILETALVLSGKIPVVLPLDRHPSRDDFARWDIRSVVSSHKVREHLPTFPWPEKFVDMAETFRDLPRGLLLWKWLCAYLEPTRLAVRRLRSAARAAEPGAETDAAGYVCVAPDGAFDLISLSHRQIIANVAQIDSANFLHRREIILTEAAPHSAAGNLFSLWLPLLAGHQVVTLSLAADDAELFTAVAEEHATALLPRASRWPALLAFQGDAPDDLRLILSFDENCIDAETAEVVREKWGASLAPASADDGAGLVMTLSMSDPDAETVTAQHQAGSRAGSVGRLLPALSARLLGPDGAELPPLEEGALHLRGVSFPVPARWMDTGRRGRFDKDGFLFLGRGAGPAPSQDPITSST